MSGGLADFARAVARSGWALSLLAGRRAVELVDRGRLPCDAERPFDTAAHAAERQLSGRLRPIYRAGCRLGDAMIDGVLARDAPFGLVRLSRGFATAAARLADSLERSCRPSNLLRSGRPPCRPNGAAGTGRCGAAPNGRPTRRSAATPIWSGGRR